ncbi:WYL domain-containing protein [Rhizobium sp. SGZ-381]|uniref:WYL domain-containing protein n=1 Tax=Rhizobium sp. SGZ-381 TaxID=3342800 RepID=UPI00366C7050
MGVWLAVGVVALFCWVMIKFTGKAPKHSQPTMADDQKDIAQVRITLSSSAPPAVASRAPISLPDEPYDYLIDYGDFGGTPTRRKIRVVEIEGGRGAVYIRAFCLMRQAERTFRADRISAAVTSDGEIIDDPEAHFFQLLPEHQRPDPDHDAVMARARGGLDLLIWIANADRQISIDEKEELLAFIEMRKGIAGKGYADLGWSRAKATRYIDEARPTLATASGYLARISRTGKEYALVKTSAEAVSVFGAEAGRRRYRQLFPARG